MLSLIIRRRNLTRSAEDVRQRAREVGAGLPDLSAPSAHIEVELSDELLAAAEEIVTTLEAGEGEHQDEAGAAKIAADEDRRLVTY